jgi:antitoxin component YwqK of YwqJK toxin-antitoxin module
MKKLILIVALSLTGMLSAQTLNDKGIYVDEEGQPFNGIVAKTQDGIRSDYSVKNGVVNGPAHYYYASGAKMETGMFLEGQRNDKWIRFTEKGNISAIAFYKAGKKDGTWIVFDDNGKKILEMNYSNGAKSGIWSQWDANGQLISTKDFSKLN